MPKEHAKTNDLNYWLSYINSVHPSKIELGLDRVKAVASEMRLGENCTENSNCCRYEWKRIVYCDHGVYS